MTSNLSVESWHQELKSGVGCCVGGALGSLERVGLTDGAADGASDGLTDGAADGAADGTDEG